MKTQQKTIRNMKKELNALIVDIRTFERRANNDEQRFVLDAKSLFLSAKREIEFAEDVNDANIFDDMIAEAQRDIKKARLMIA